MPSEELAEIPRNTSLYRNRAWAVPILTLLLYDKTLNQALVVEGGDSNFNLNWWGAVYRHCVLSEAPDNVPEVAYWEGLNATRNISGSYFDSADRTLYIATCTQTDYLFSVKVDNATDCPSTLPPPPSVSSSSSLLPDLFEFNPFSFFFKEE